MRNLIEHPITDQEIVGFLKHEADNSDEGVCGDMKPLLLQTAADIIASRNLGRIAKLEAIAAAAADLIHDDREWGEEVVVKMGGHRRIKLADALKALKK